MILGNLSDGTLPPPAPKRALPDFEIRESFEARLPDRNISIHRVKNPGLPDPIPVKESLFAAREFGAWKNSPQFLEWRARREKTTDLWLSASVVEHRATLLRWHHDGNEFLAWSNIDFHMLSTIRAFSKGDRTFNSFMSVGDVRVNSPGAGSRFQIPENLPPGAPAFIVVKGDPARAAAFTGVAALHELAAAHAPQLLQAWTLRRQREQQRAADLLANPPVPEDIILYHSKVQPKRKKLLGGNALLVTGTATPNPASPTR